MKFFQKCAREHHKINIPSQFDESIAESILDWVNWNKIDEGDLDALVEKYVNNRALATVSIREFAEQIERLHKSFSLNKESHKNFDKLLEETRLRMERAKEMDGK